MIGLRRDRIGAPCASAFAPSLGQRKQMIKPVALPYAFAFQGFRQIFSYKLKCDAAYSCASCPVKQKPKPGHATSTQQSLVSSVSGRLTARYCQKDPGPACDPQLASMFGQSSYRHQLLLVAESVTRMCCCLLFVPLTAQAELWIAASRCGKRLSAQLLLHPLKLSWQV